MKNIFLITTCILIAIGLIACGKKESVKPSLSQKEQIAAPTHYPVLSLLKGKVLLIDMSGTGVLTKDSVYRGTAYLVGQYRGKENLSASTGLVIFNANDIVPISDFNFFSQNDRKKANVLDEETIRKLNIALGHYNVQAGYLEAQSPLILDIATIKYNPAENKVEMLKEDGRVVFTGSIVDLDKK